MKKILKIAAVMIASFSLALFSGAWYFSSVLLHPGPFVCDIAHFVYCRDPSEIGLAFENVEFTTSDGLALSAWYIPGDGRKGGILMVHGRGAYRTEGLRYAASLHNRGFNLLYMDSRNCGASQKSFNSMGYYERRDVIAGIDYLLNSRHVPSAGVMGFSLGASTSILAMSEDARIKAGVFDSPFASLETILVEAAWQDYHLPRYPLLPLVRLLFEKRGHLDMNELNPIDKIASISPRPVFIIHGTADERTPFHHGEDIYRAAREPKQFWAAPGGMHTRAWQVDREKADTMVGDFFQRYL